MMMAAAAAAGVPSPSPLSAVAAAATLSATGDAGLSSSGALALSGSAPAATAFLDVDPRSGLAGALSETALRRGMVARFMASKLNRYYRWQGRVFTVRLDTNDVVVNEVAGEASHRFRLSAIAHVERVTKDLSARQLRIVFNRAAVGPDFDKDYVLRFEDNATRETFCTLLHLLEPDVPVADDSVHVIGGGRVAYDVLMLTRAGVKQRRILTLDSRARVLSRCRADYGGHTTDWKAAASAAALGGGHAGVGDGDSDDDGLSGSGSNAGSGSSGSGGGGSGSGAAPRTSGPGLTSGSGSGLPGSAAGGASGAGGGGASGSNTGSGSLGVSLSRDLPITVSTRLEPSPADPCRLRLIFGEIGRAHV